MRTRAVSGCTFSFLAVVSLCISANHFDQDGALAQGDSSCCPANNLGMGGVSIALADTLLDPFVIRRRACGSAFAILHIAHRVHHVAEHRRRALAAFAALIGSGAWFGGLAVALQAD